MLNRRRGIFADAFNQTFYNRVVAKEEPIKSGIFGFLGLPMKYKVDPRDSSKTILEWDRNFYNWIEQIVFLPLRLAKNTAKLATEFLPHVLANTIKKGANYFYDKARAIKELPISAEVTAGEQLKRFAKYWANMLPGLLLSLVSLAPRLVAKVGQSITSPFAAMKETKAAVQKATGYKALGYIAGALHGALILAAYTGISVFAAPYLATALSPILGTQWTTAVVSNLSMAVNWFGSLPVISTIGAGLSTALSSVASFVGLSMPAAVAASAATVAASAVFVAPVLAGLKALVRYISPLKSLFYRVKPAAKNLASSAPTNLAGPDAPKTDLDNSSNVDLANTGSNPSASSQSVDLSASSSSSAPAPAPTGTVSNANPVDSSAAAPTGTAASVSPSNNTAAAPSGTVNSAAINSALNSAASTLPVGSAAPAEMKAAAPVPTGISTRPVSPGLLHPQAIRAAKQNNDWVTLAGHMQAANRKNTPSPTNEAKIHDEQPEAVSQSMSCT